MDYFFIVATSFYNAPRYYFIPFSMLIISSVLLVYLTTYGRVPFRAVYIIWLSLSVFICYSFSKDDFHFQKLLSKFPKAIGGFTSVCLVLISLFGITFSVNANSTIPTFDNNNDVIALRNYLNENLDKRYELARSVVVDDCSEVYLIDDVWKNNYLIFNCTYYRSRFFEKQMSILDVNNMYSDLLGKEIFWIDKKNQSHKDMFEQYLNKYYSHGKKINMQVTDCIGDYVVYMISE